LRPGFSVDGLFANRLFPGLAVFAVLKALTIVQRQVAAVDLPQAIGLRGAS
jgi:hypothetical protein